MLFHNWAFPLSLCLYCSHEGRATRRSEQIFGDLALCQWHIYPLKVLLRVRSSVQEEPRTDWNLSRCPLVLSKYCKLSSIHHRLYWLWRECNCTEVVLEVKWGRGLVCSVDRLRSRDLPVLSSFHLCSLPHYTYCRRYGHDLLRLTKCSPRIRQSTGQWQRQLGAASAAPKHNCQFRQAFPHIRLVEIQRAWGVCHLPATFRANWHGHTPPMRQTPLFPLALHRAVEQESQRLPALQADIQRRDPRRRPETTDYDRQCWGFRHVHGNQSRWHPSFSVVGR